jgi:hypothetical protein
MESEFYHKLWNPPEDYEMALEWAAGHGNGFTPLRWLPANGFVVLRDDEPILMFWMYFDNSSPVTFVEWVVSRPGLKASETRAALVYAMDEIIPQMMMMGGAEVVSTRSPKAFVRDMVKNGWSIHDKELCSMVYVLQEEEVLNETL